MTPASRIWQSRLSSWREWGGSDSVRLHDQVLAAVLSKDMDYPTDLVASLIADRESDLGETSSSAPLSHRIRIVHGPHTHTVPIASVTRVVDDVLWTTASEDHVVGLVGGTPLPSAWDPDGAALAVVVQDEDGTTLYPASRVAMEAP